MTHADKYGVGLLSMGLMVAGVLIVMILLTVLILTRHRFMPRTRSQTVYWIGAAIMWPLMIAALPLASFASWHLVVIADFGWDAYAHGLRLVNKHGLLNDGRFLSTFWAAAWGAGLITFYVLTVIPFTLWHLHFRSDGHAPTSVSLTGTVRLDGEPLPRALLTFHSVAMDTARSCATALANDVGWYGVDLPAGRYHVTIESAIVALPVKYGDPAQTPLQVACAQLGPAERDLDVQTWSAPVPQPVMAGPA